MAATAISTVWFADLVRNRRRRTSGGTGLGVTSASAAEPYVRRSMRGGYRNPPLVVDPALGRPDDHERADHRDDEQHPRHRRGVPHLEVREAL